MPSISMSSLLVVRRVSMKAYILWHKVNIEKRPKPSHEYYCKEDPLLYL